MQSLKCPQCNLVNFAANEKCKRCNASLNDANNSDPKISSTAWYYSEEGKRIGPVTDNSLRQLVGNGTISSKTLVWQNGMPDWTAAYQTNLASLFASTQTEPPPLIGDAVDNNLAWIIALAPLISGVLQVFISIFSGIPTYKFWWIAIILNISLCIADESRLKNAGHNTKNMFLWSLIFMPAYLFVRAARLKQDNSYAIVWLITFFISIFVF